MNFNLAMGAIGGLALVINAVPVAAAGDVSDARVDEFVALIAGSNCIMTEQVAAGLLPDQGFVDKSETKSIVAILIARGEARIDEGALVLIGGACGGDPVGTPSDRLVAAIRANNCRMSEDEANTILPGIGLDKTQVRELVGQLIGQGVITVSGDTISVSGSDCAPSDNPAPQNFVTVVIDNGCRITKQQAAELLPAAGVREDQVNDIVQMLLATGQASIVSQDGQSVVVLSEQLCATGTLATAAAAPATGGNLRAAFVDFMSDRNCTIMFADAKIELPAAGLDFRQVGDLVDILLAEGVASVGDPNQTLTLSAEICG